MEGSLRAKMMVNPFLKFDKVRRRHKKRGLHIRKKLGPRTSQ
ncbi:MAG: hypothetical protein CM15mV111_020 [uncultured marine virus]|nr:MAG: hypothetical protein CM15mV111_020 [uncultured marine virus]